MQNFQQENQYYQQIQPVKDNTKKGLTIIVICTLVFSLLLCCFFVGFVALGKYIVDNEIVFPDYEDFYGKTLQEIDSERRFELKDDQTFIYHYDEEDLSKSINGTYSLYFNDIAIEYVSNNLEEYGLTKEEQENVNNGYGDYKDYVCIVFEPNGYYENNVKIELIENMPMPYIGHTIEEKDDVYYDLFNVNLMQYEQFIQE